MKMLLILREEILCAVILIFLIFYYMVNKVKDREMLFLKLSCLALCHVVFDIITVITVNSRDVVPDPVNRLVHVCFYISGLLFATWFYNYIVQLTVRYRYVQRMRTAGYAIVVLFVLSLVFLPMEYESGVGTDYSYGPLAIIGYALFLLYCTACFAMLLIARRNLDKRIRRSLIPMLAAMYAAVILQAVIPELLMTGGNVTLICIAMFVAMDNPDKDFREQALWDFLTGLKNRNCYSRDMARYREHGFGRRKPRRIGFIVADMNYLKAVNDEFGHAEGDRLIAAAAKALRINLKTAQNLYRLGGDEFAAVYLSPEDELVRAEMGAVARACAAEDAYAVPLSIAMGYAAGNLDDEPLEEIFRRADKLMYDDKQRIKLETPELSRFR